MNNENLLMTIENCIEIDSNKIVIKGCVKSGCIRLGDKVYIIDTYGKRISTTVEAVEMFGKCLDYAECGDNNIGILLGNNIVYDDIKVGHQIISDVSLNATEAESVIEDSYDDNALYNCGLSKTVKVTYNADTLQTEITVDGQPFDTSRINGKEIADWAYPFMMRKVKWNGFYDEMVEALGGDKEFNLIFEGSDEALAELKEAWEDAPVTIISEEESENIVVIEYDEKTLTTNITVNGQPFDTSRINGKEIEDWVYPFMMRKVKWNGIFEELAKVVGSEDYTIQFLGSDTSLSVLSEEVPDNIKMQNSIDKENTPKSFSDDDKLRKAEELYILGKTMEALPIFEELAENGNGRAMYFLGEYYTHGDCGIAKNEEKGTYWRKKGAEAGDLLAKLNTGYNHDINSPIRAKIFDEVLPAIQQLADANNAIAQKELADLYSGSHNKITNRTKAFELLKMSADAGYFRSILQMGDCYMYGDCVPEDPEEAVHLFKKLAEIGCPQAENALGLCYYTGDGVAQNYNEAVKWYTKAAEHNLAIAQFNLGMCYYSGKGIAQNYSEAVKWFKKSAEQDVHTAMDKLGDCYYWGHGVEEDNDKAVEWYMKAAKAGNPKAQFTLGGLYYNGLYFEKNYEEAVKWFTSAAKKNNKAAQYSLGNCYYLGHGVVQNYTKAAEWYKKAAEQGEDRAQDSLGDCYYFGDGVQQNYEKAVEWYTESANQGNVSAMYDLAICYYYGKGVDTNYQQAAELFIDAVNQGHVESMNFLGDCYYEGRGVSQNYSKAVSLYEKALNENSPQAYYNLGSCYRWGNGVRKDKEKAKELFKKGIELGNQNCKEAYEDMLKNADRIETAKRIGGKILTVLGEVGGAYAQAYYSDDDDE